MTLPRYGIWHLMLATTAAAFLFAAYLYGNYWGAGLVLSLYAATAAYRNAITVVELVVCLSIIGLLLALLEPSHSAGHGRRMLSIVVQVCDETTGLPLGGALAVVDEFGLSNANPPVVTDVLGVADVQHRVSIYFRSVGAIKTWSMYVHDGTLLRVTADGYEPHAVSLYDVVRACDKRSDTRRITIACPLRPSAEN